MGKIDHVSVSVLMALHKGDDLDDFEQSINSIINQTEKNFEIIISIDGEISGDVKSFIASTVRQSNCIIKIVESQINEGPAAARNKASLIAEGKYIAIMDADDLASPNRLKIQKKYLDDYQNVGVVGSNYIEFQPGIKEIIRILPECDAQIKDKLTYRCSLANPTIMMRKHVFKKYLYDKNYRKSEDYEMWVRMAKGGVSFHNIQEPLIKYRIKENFYQKRRGIEYAKNDFKVKLQALALAKTVFLPVLLPLAFLTFLIRLAPPRVVYFLRNLVHNADN